jgi:hypothetical protein
MNFDPKKAFNESDHAKVWHDVVASKGFHAAAEAALANMQMNLPTPPDMATAAANDWRMQGARRFLNELMTLTEIGSIHKEASPFQPLNYRALK